jgi:hypothetical protein
MMVALIALFVALGGTSVAAFKLKANSVGSKQIKPDAATGADVNEATLAKVPSAAASDTASRAVEAQHSDSSDSLGGLSADDVVGGTGSEFAFADELGTGNANGIIFGGNGELDLTCDATPQLTWENDFNDAGTPPTDIWTSPAGHTTVADGTSNTVLDADMANETEDVEIWTGDDDVLSVHVSSSWDGASHCEISMFAHTSPNGLGPAGTARSQERIAARAAAPVQGK